ncbi:MAG: nuclear transport factor 2 family protein, partial [Bacillota bacterium]
WTGNNPEKLIDYYSRDAFYSDPANKGGLKGYEQLMAYFRKLLAANPGWKWEVVEIFPTEKGFTLKWKATIPIGSEQVIEYGLDIVEVENGKITRNEVYFDRTALLTVLNSLKQKG